MTQTVAANIHPHDADLPPQVIRKRRRHRRFARLVIVLAVLFGIAGWIIFSTSILAAIHIHEESPFRAIIAYGFLITSSIMLVLGLWYLLLAQVQRIARMVEGDPETERAAALLCPNCGWFRETNDRFCRHCGKPIGAAIRPAPTVEKI